jgi:hypothetical protein
LYEDTANAPPVVENGTVQQQLYSQITFPWLDNSYLGLVSVFDSEQPSTFGSRFGFGKVHCRLSISTDLMHWKWVDNAGLNGADFIPLGTPSTTRSTNAFDSHICFAAASPLQMEDGSARVYYMGGNGPVSLSGRHLFFGSASFIMFTVFPSFFFLVCLFVQHNGDRNSSLAVATLNSWNHFAGVSGSGNVTLMTLKVTGKKLLITMDVESGSGGWVQIGTYEENRLWPSRCRKVAKSVVEEEVTGDYTKFIGKEIA